MRASLMKSVLPPLVFVVAAVGILWIVNAFMLPLVNFINVISSGSFWRRGQPGMPLWWDDVMKYAAISIAVTTGLWLVMILLMLLRGSALVVFVGRLFGRNKNQARRGTLRRMMGMLMWFLTFFVLFVFMVGLTGGFDFSKALWKMRREAAFECPGDTRRGSNETTLIIISGWGLMLWISTLIIAIILKIRHGEMERRTLVWLLSAAMEKGIPLPSAARAFADERHDKLGIRARRLAIVLDQGLPLDRALSASHIRLPNDALVAVRTGCNAQGTAELLKQAARNASIIDIAIQGAVGRLVYLLLFMFFTSFVLGFVNVKIVPAFQKIFQIFISHCRRLVWR